MSDRQLLDNPVWHALEGPHAGLRVDIGPVRRYRPDVALFAALEAPHEGGLEALVAALPPGGAAALVTDRPVTVPAELRQVRLASVLQMVAAVPGVPEAGGELIALGDAHVPQMLELVALTQPGPFLPRTIEMGRYLGIFEADRLVAMAGERMRLHGLTEVSAVCTHPDQRGRGHAKRLVSALVAGITGRSETPFLHVIADNQSVIATYERLGFSPRHVMSFTVLARP